MQASIRLGMSTALFRGDRFLFVKTSGRLLDTKEEAVVLGAFRGQLWYRLDNQLNEGRNELVESAALAWCLVRRRGSTRIRYRLMSFLVQRGHLWEIGFSVCVFF